MDIHSLLKELKNLRPDKQIEKLRALKKSVSQDQLSILEQASKEAGEPWLASALLGIVNSKKLPIPKEKASEKSEDTYDVDAIRSEAISDSIGQILHELEPLIGSINLLARSEVSEFKNSKIKHELELLEDTIETFENWRKVEQPPQYKQCNILKIINKEWKRLAPISTVDLTINVSSELEFEIDPSLLRIICWNALKNSVESCKAETVREKKPIVISASTTNNSLWISIIDDGIGLQGKSDQLMKSRFTTKPGNQGFGLATIQKAVSSMNGIWDLKDSKQHGAELFVEIPKKEF